MENDDFENEIASLTQDEIQYNLEGHPDVALLLPGSSVSKVNNWAGDQSPSYSPSSVVTSPAQPSSPARAMSPAPPKFPGDVVKFIINAPERATPEMMRDITPQQMLKLKDGLSTPLFAKLPFQKYSQDFMTKLHQLDNARKPHQQTKKQAQERNTRNRGRDAGHRGEDKRDVPILKNRNNMLIPKPPANDVERFTAMREKNQKPKPGGPPREIEDLYISKTLKPLPYLDRLIRLSVYANLPTSMTVLLSLYDDIISFDVKDWDKEEFLKEQFTMFGLISSVPSDLISTLTFYWLIDEPKAFLALVHRDVPSVTLKSKHPEERKVEKSLVYPADNKEIFIKLAQLPEPKDQTTLEKKTPVVPAAIKTPAVPLPLIKAPKNEKVAEVKISPMLEIGEITPIVPPAPGMVFTQPCSCKSIEELAQKRCGYHPNVNEPTIENLRANLYGVPPSKPPLDGLAPLPPDTDPMDVIFEKDNSMFLNDYYWIENFYNWISTEKRMTLNNLIAGPPRDGRNDSHVISTMLHTDPKTALYYYGERYVLNLYFFNIPITFWFDCGKMLVSRELATQVCTSTYFSSEDELEPVVDRIRKSTSITGTINYDRTITLACHNQQRDTAFFCKNMWNIMQHLKRDQPFLGNVVQRQGLKAGSLYSDTELMRLFCLNILRWTRQYVFSLTALRQMSRGLSCVFHSAVTFLALPIAILTRLIPPLRYLALHTVWPVMSGQISILPRWLDLGHTYVLSSVRLSIPLALTLTCLSALGWRGLIIRRPADNTFRNLMIRTFICFLMYFLLLLSRAPVDHLLRMSLTRLINTLEL